MLDRLDPATSVVDLDNNPNQSGGDAQYRILYYLTRMFSQWVDYARRYQAFKTGITLDDNDGWDVKAHINFFYRFCKTHASYVVKDTPSVHIPPEYPDQPDSKMLAAMKERFLIERHKSESFGRKLKTAALRGSIFGDQYFFLNVRKDTINIEVLDPSNIIYDTVDSDPYSPVTKILRVRWEDVKTLKKKYPQFATRIGPSTYAQELNNINSYIKSSMYAFDKALVCYYMDDKYMYTFINASIEVEKKEHGYDFLPFYHRKYIDIGDRYGMSVVDTIYEPVKYMHLALSYVITNAYDLAVAPLISTSGIPQMADQKGRVKWLITVPPQSDVKYLNPPQSNMDLYKTLEFAKSFMHFISGISEEAMAGFTGALTSAGVSIELRMDSTVRETLDCQITLQDILQRMNADALRLFEKHFATKNLFDNPVFGEARKLFPFTGNMIGKNYRNIVDFGGILPRSDAQIVQNVLSKYKMNVISHDTALEELRYSDPTLEITKLQKEQVDKQKLARALQEWSEADITGFEWPKDENYYMLTEQKPVQVLPSQNHLEHYNMHMAAYAKTQNQLLLLHAQIHQQLYSKASGIQPSTERPEQWFGGQPQTPQQVPMQ